MDSKGYDGCQVAEASDMYGRSALRCQEYATSYASQQRSLEYPEQCALFRDKADKSCQSEFVTLQALVFGDMPLAGCRGAEPLGKLFFVESLRLCWLKGSGNLEISGGFA